SEEERRAGLTLPILPLPRPQSSSPLSLCLCPMNGLPHGQNGKDSFVYLRGMDPREDEDTVSIGELPDRSLSGEFEEALRKVSFSSIASFDTRNTYISALDTLREATFPHLLLTRKSLRQSSKFSPLSSPSSSMDSPSDLSPNAPPGGIEGYPADQFAAAAAAAAAKNEPLHSDEPVRETTSGNDSEDSSGFEKVDPHSDLLADYTTNFHNQMQQSLYGQLPSDPSARSQGVDLLGDFEDEPPMDSHHGVGDILEHAYDQAHQKVDDVIGHLAECEGAKAIEKAVHEVPQAVDDFVHQDHHFVDPPKQTHSAMDDLSDLMGDVIQKPSTLVPEPIKEMLVDAPISPSEDSGRDTVSKLLGDHSDSDEPDFGQQTPEEDTFQRDGPLRIPTDLIEQAEPEDLPLPSVPSHHDHHHGFETVARPPTPPKDISDEDVKPSTVHLGHHEPHHDPHRSILKHSGSTSPSGKGPWFNFKSVDPRVLDLIYWRDPKKSGIALGAILTVLFILTRFPLITVLSYSGLAVLTGTVGFRVIKAVEAQIKKTDGSNPFQVYLEQDLSIPQDRVREQVDVIVEHAQCLARQLRRLFLVESIVDSVKFGLLLWSFTYIGAWFSGCTLVFLAVIAIFSVPKIYETYQEPIDAQLAVVKGHIDNVTNILEEKLPFLKRAAVETEKKDQ
ncbi:ret-1, partial [Pristionchus pacificus]